MSKNLKKLILVIFNFLIISIVGILQFFLVFFLSTFLLAFLLKQLSSDMTMGLVAFSGGTGAALVLIPLSLYPSYKISLWLSRKVKDWWGWEIEKPKRLFWLSVLLIILLVFVLPFLVNFLF